MYQICIFVSSAWYALDSSEPSLLKFNIFSRNNTESYKLLIDIISLSNSKKISKVFLELQNDKKIPFDLSESMGTIRTWPMDGTSWNKI